MSSFSLEELQTAESRKYTELLVSLWHIKDVRSLTYTDSENRSLTVFLNAEGKMTGAKYKENRYERGAGVDYRIAEQVPEWTNGVYGDFFAAANVRNTEREYAPAMSYTKAEYETR